VVNRCRARFNVPPNTLEVVSRTGFYGSNDPTNSIKALKETAVVKPLHAVEAYSSFVTATDWKIVWTPVAI